jgi:beta-phosphoglucomutase-like phosphatase (HAD superfamily)
MRQEEPSRKQPQRLGIAPADAVVVEDSRPGLLAAHAGGMGTLVATTAYTRKEDFSEAALVVSSPGDPADEETRVIADPRDIRPGRYVTLADIEAYRA